MQLSVAHIGLALGLWVVGLSAPQPAAAADLKDRRIAYIVTDLGWPIYQTEDKKDCPDGFNDGPRAQFDALYPDNGQPRTLVDTQLKRQIANWYPTESEDRFPFREAKGPVSYGLNLDGKVGENDYIGVNGERGVDNQLFRALGCTLAYRAPNGAYYAYTKKYIRRYNYNRVMFELTNVDSLANDDQVDVTIYRGRDRLLTDATGNQIMAGGTQRIDYRFGSQFIQHLRGKIVDGTLITEPADVVWPWAERERVPGAYVFRGFRFQLKLTPDNAQGLLAGYADVDAWYTNLAKTSSSYYFSYGHVPAPSLNRALHRLADGYPDPRTGANTAISFAAAGTFAQVFIDHGDEDKGGNAKSAQQSAGR